MQKYVICQHFGVVPCVYVRASEICSAICGMRYVDLHKNLWLISYKERFYRSCRHTSCQSCNLLFSVRRVL